jgi:hypothetical protein
MVVRRARERVVDLMPIATRKEHPAVLQECRGAVVAPVIMFPVRAMLPIGVAGPREQAATVRATRTMTASTLGAPREKPLLPNLKFM